MWKLPPSLLRALDFFSGFGDVELWEVVHRTKWQRFHFGHPLYRKGEGCAQNRLRRIRRLGALTARSAGGADNRPGIAGAACRDLAGTLWDPVSNGG